MAGPARSSSARWDLPGRDLEVLLREAAAFRGESLWNDAWRRLRKNRAAHACLVFLVLVALGSLFAPLLPVPSPAALDLGIGEPGPPVLDGLGDQGWRHRTIFLFRAPAERHDDVRALVERVSGRAPIVPPPFKELPVAADGELLLAVPLRTSDVPGVDYVRTDVRGSARVTLAGAEPVDADDPAAVASVVLEMATTRPLSAWALELVGREVRLTGKASDPPAGIQDYQLRLKLRKGETRLAGLTVVGEALALAERAPKVQAGTVDVFEYEGRIRNDLGRRMREALATDPALAGVELASFQWEDAYWELNPFDRGMLWLRGSLFGLWQAKSWLGTDAKGRDVLARIVWGSRTSILVAVAATLCSLVIGVTYGATSGYLGGRTDNLMMRIVDVLYSVPFIFVVIFIMTAVNEYRSELADFGIDRELIIYLVIGAIYWLTMARVVRGQVLSLKSSEFIEAARVIGASTPRILLVHLVPNVLSIVIVYLTLTIPAVMLFEAFLSFLGLGIESPKVSWGLLATDSTEAFSPIKVYWWVVIWPAAAMGSTLLALNVLGDGLRDALDPKLRGKD